MKSRLLGIVISMLCATSFLAANGAVDSKAEKAPVIATGTAADVKTEAAEGAKKEVANADEVAKAEEAAKAKAKKAEEKPAQDKKSCSGCK